MNYKLGSNLAKAVLFWRMPVDPRQSRRSRHRPILVWAGRFGYAVNWLQSANRGRADARFSQCFACRFQGRAQ